MISPIYKKALIVLFFGILVVLFGGLQFKIPGSLGLKTNFTEVAIFCSLPYLSNIYMAIAISLFSAINVSSEGSIFASTFGHTLGIIFLYFSYKKIKNVNKHHLTTIYWFVLSTIYYFFILIPFIYGTHFIVGRIDLNTAFSYILSTSRHVVPEWLISSILAIFYYITRSEHIKRIQAQNALQNINLELQKNLDVLNKIAYIDTSTSLPNGKQLELDFKNLKISNNINSTYLGLIGFRLIGLEYLNQTKGLEFASNTFSNIIESFNTTLESILENNPEFKAPIPLKNCYRLDQSTVVFPLVSTENYESLKIFEGDQFSQFIQNEISQRNLNAYISFQGGITIFPSDANTFEQLLKNLLNMIHSEKSTSIKHFVKFNPIQYNKYLRNEQIHHLFEQAIQNNEFYIVYQPKINLNTEKVTGFEALTRWDNPVLGKILPLEFIPIAEQYNYIEPLTKLLINDILKFIDNIKAIDSLKFRIAINISASLLTIEFIDFLIDEFQKNDCSQYIEIEITESTLVKITPIIYNKIKILKIIGVSIAIDDFGTGYSNLMNLQNFKPDVLKIDKSFIDGIPYIRESCKLSKVVFDIAKTFDMTVVAEGVETIEQKEYLKKIDCQVVQGYLYSKPLKYDDAIDYIQKSLSVSLRSQ